MQSIGLLKTTILSVEDDDGHAILIRENLEQSGTHHPIERFSDGQEILDFFFRAGATRMCREGETYIVLLDIRMPKIDGIEVLRRLKADPKLRTLPVIMLTTTEDARAVEQCHRIGCSAYVQKPVSYEKFSEAICQLGKFISLLLVPPMTMPLFPEQKPAGSN